MTVIFFCYIFQSPIPYQTELQKCFFRLQEVIPPPEVLLWPASRFFPSNHCQDGGEDVFTTMRHFKSNQSAKHQTLHNQLQRILRVTPCFCNLQCNKSSPFRNVRRKMASHDMSVVACNAILIK